MDEIPARDEAEVALPNNHKVDISGLRTLRQLSTTELMDEIERRSFVVVAGWKDRRTGKTWTRLSGSFDEVDCMLRKSINHAYFDFFKDPFTDEAQANREWVKA